MLQHLFSFKIWIATDSKVNINKHNFLSKLNAMRSRLKGRRNEYCNQAPQDITLFEVKFIYFKRVKFFLYNFRGITLSMSENIFKIYIEREVDELRHRTPKNVKVLTFDTCATCTCFQTRRAAHLWRSLQIRRTSSSLSSRRIHTSSLSGPDKALSIARSSESASKVCSTMWGALIPTMSTSC